MIKQVFGFLVLLLFVMLLAFNQQYLVAAEKHQAQIYAVVEKLDYQGKERYRSSLLFGKYKELPEDYLFAHYQDEVKALNQAKQIDIFSNENLIDLSLAKDWIDEWPNKNAFAMQQARVSAIKSEFLNAKFEQMSPLELNQFVTDWLSQFLTEVNLLQELNQEYGAQLLDKYLNPSLHQLLWVNSSGVIAIMLLCVSMVYMSYHNRNIAINEIAAKLQAQNKALKDTQVILESQTEDLLVERNNQAALLGKLKDAQTRAQLINQFLPIGLMLVQSDGRIVEVNQETCQLFGYSESELLEMKVEALVPEAMRANHSRLREGFKKESAPRKMAASATSLEGERKDGSMVPLEIGLAPIELGGKYHVLASLVDVSDRNEVLEQLQNKNTQMDATLEILRQSNAQLEQFAFVCSHDLQEPLRMVASFSQLLERTAGDKLSDKSKGYLKHVIDGSMLAREMISDILSYCRIDQSHDDEPYLEMRLADVIDQVNRTLEPTLTEDNAVLEWPDDLPTVQGVPSQLFQLFMNLISNGIKFNLSSRPKVVITATKLTDWWEIKVSDNGIGIYKSHIPKMFEIFNRLNAKTDFPGTGIGLAICKRIVERHGGSIRVESVVNEGSDFIIEWPVQLLIEQQSQEKSL